MTQKYRVLAYAKIGVWLDVEADSAEEAKTHALENASGILIEEYSASSDEFPAWLTNADCLDEPTEIEIDEVQLLS